MKAVVGVKAAVGVKATTDGVKPAAAGLNSVTLVDMTTLFTIGFVARPFA